MNGGMTMDIKQGIQDVLYLIITGILPLLITYGILFLKVKIKEQEKNLENDQLVKYIDAATDATGTQATFGQGGNASGYSCGGGGGGWYGGGGAYDNDSDSDGRWGGGGSGYVYTSSTAKNYPNGCLLNSTHYLTNAKTIAGNKSFKSPTGKNETGHTGNGFCRITNLTPTQYGLYVKTNSGWEHIDL